MNERLRNITVLVALFGYLLAGAIVEISHRDSYDTPIDPQAVLASHNCGAHELHIPLDHRHDCLACTHSAVRIAITAQALPASLVSFLRLGRVPVNNGYPAHPDLFYSGKRGPPASVSLA